MKLRKKTNWRPYLETLEARRLMSVYADFNGDGRDDLAIGVPGEDSDSGGVHVLYGTASGLSSTNSELWSQDSTFGAFQVPDVKEAGDQFGASLAGGDFNGDGFADLAIGVPGEDIGSATDAGAVNILYGRAVGLGMDSKTNKIWHQDINRVRGIAETGDFFGGSLASGDFNNDGFFDLAVGLPGQDLPGKTDAGEIHIFYGGTLGINATANQAFNLDGPLPGSADAGDQFGAALAVGDFDGNSVDDLAIGTPFFDLIGDEGTVFTMFGSANGLTTTGSVGFLLSGNGAHHGTALASGDFNGDGMDDLVTGAPNFDLSGAVTFVGKIQVLVGSPSGLIFGPAYMQSDFGLTNETNDNFGASLTVGDFNNNGFDDVAIGIVQQDVGGIVNSGAVLIAFGSAAGVQTGGSVTLTQTTAGSTEEADDHFGEAISAGDYNGDGNTDVAIGTPDENVLAVVDAGAVYVLYGGGTFTGGQTWTQDTTGIFDTAETGDSFGGGLDAGGGRDTSSDGPHRRAASLFDAGRLPDRPLVREIAAPAVVVNRAQSHMPLIATLGEHTPTANIAVAKPVHAAKLPPLFAFDLDLDKPLA